MEIEVKTSIEPFYRNPILRKIPICFIKKMPVIEGYESLLYVEYRDSEAEKDVPFLSIKPVIVEPHGIERGVDRWGLKPWLQQNNLSMKFSPSVSGYIELRVYFKDLKDSDEIIDDYGRSQPFKGDIGNDKAIRYYFKPYKIYSLYEVLMIFFTGTVTIFTLLMLIITILLYFSQ